MSITPMIMPSERGTEKRKKIYGTTDPYGSSRNEDTEDEIRKAKKCIKI